MLDIMNECGITK